MAVKIKFGGATLVAETREDLAMLMDELSAREKAPQGPTRKKANTTKDKGKPSIASSPMQYSPKRTQRNLLGVLYKHSEGVSDEVARRILGFENNKQLAGSLASLNRVLYKRFDLGEDDVILSQFHRADDGTRGYLYQIGPGLRKLLKKGQVAME